MTPKSALSILALLALALVIFSSTDHSDAVSTPVSSSINVDADRLPQIIKSVSLDKAYSIAGEAVPTENFDVLERFERELLVNSYWHSSTVLNLKNAKRYFPMIEPILAEKGVPDDFKYVAVIESNLRNETSPAGAKGIWQFMPAVAKGYGLEISKEVDERYHLEKSTYAACELILDYHRRFGTWTNAIGAYNMGETRFARERERQQMNSYYDMNFGAETSRYLFRVLALKEIMERPEDFGFYIEESDQMYQPLRDCIILKVDQTIPNLGNFAKENGTTYRMLKIYNPWLISSRLTVASGKTYQIKIPK